MSPLRPDLVDCWIYRDGPVSSPVGSGPVGPEILLLRRASGRILPGLWQCVSGSLEAGERVTDGARREVEEETGFSGETILAFYDLDLVNQFHEPSVDAVMLAAVFAMRVRRTVDVRLSDEHDVARWLTIDDALDAVIWPGYRTAIERIRDDLSDGDRARWFELTTAGERAHH